MEFLRKNYLYILFGIGSFSTGAYIWKVANTGQELVGADFTLSNRSSLQRSSVIVEVGDTSITTDDVDFEYSLLTKGVFDAEELTPIPDLGARYEQELSPLKEELLSAMIERKLLFTYIQQHTEFNIEDPKRFVSCLEEWQKTVNNPILALVAAGDRERLKQRLCEKSVLNQYLNEVTYPSISVTETEIQEYYEANKSEFNKPKRVLIRQIVLPDEKAATDANRGLNRLNFASRAKELSITPEAARGGLLGPFSQSELPRVFDVAFTMRTGDIYGILKSTYGFHLIMLEEKLPAETLSLNDAIPQIRETLLQTKKEKIFQEWIETALNTVQVKSPRPLW